MAEKQDENENISFALPEQSIISADWTGTHAVIDSQLSVDAEPWSPNLTAWSEGCITSVQEGTGQTGREQSEPKGANRSSNDETTHLHRSMTYPGTPCLPEDHHGIEIDAFSLSSSQSTSSLQKDWEKKLKEYDKDLCDIEHDVMILYSEDDIKAVEIFKDHLEKDIILPDKRRVDVVLYDEFRLSGLSFENLDRAFDKCSFTFVFLTKNFVENTWCKIISESCLMKIIQDPRKGWRVVPVYTKRLAESDFRIPMGLNALKGVNYYNNDEYYRKGVAKMIRENRQKVEREKQKRLQIQNNRKELFTSRGLTYISSQQEESSTRTNMYQECFGKTEVTCELEHCRQSNTYFSGQMQPDSIEIDNGITHELDSLLCEDSSPAIPGTYQTISIQENTDKQENIEKQKPDVEKRIQSGGSKAGLLATEVESESTKNDVRREKPVGVVRPSGQTTSGAYLYCHIWQYCSVHGRHYKVFECFYRTTTTKEPPEDYDVNTID